MHDVVRTFHGLVSVLILTSATIFARGVIPDSNAEIRAYRELREDAAAYLQSNRGG